MAVSTPLKYREWMIYEVFIRNHFPKGTIKSLIDDIPRIKQLGMNVVWLMPFYPIGRKDRKGCLGSPYAIMDYRQVDPELGTLEDFRQLSETVHANGMKLMIDIVFHHVSPDSRIATDHPEWIRRDTEGHFLRKVPDWSDIVDLDYAQPELWDYLIESLMFWLEAGTDGFRCDVAPLVPLDFWLKARRTIDSIRPDCIWMAESVEPHFIRHLRNQGYDCSSDGELYQAFDICYDYDSYGLYAKAVLHPEKLPAWIDAVTQQANIYPRNYIKLRFLENHDQKRAADLISNPITRLNWTALQLFLPGTGLIYCGQEYQLTHQPSHFDSDPIVPSESELSDEMIRIIQTMAEIKPRVSHGVFELALDEKTMIVKAYYRIKDQMIIGLFNLLRARGNLFLPEIPAKQGINLLTGSPVHILNHNLTIDDKPMVLAFSVKTRSEGVKV